MRLPAGRKAARPSDGSAPPKAASRGSRFPRLRRVLQAVATRGLCATARLLLHAAATRLHLARTPEAPRPLDPYPRSIPEAIHPFDLRHNVETSGFLQGLRLPGAGVWSTAYYAIAPSVFDRAMKLLGTPERPPHWRHFTFVDLGCGKGRALLLAARYPFGHILGVELDPALAAVATRNLGSFSAAWQQCHSMEVRVADATTLELPPTPLVLYLYHPFLAPALQRVLSRLESSLRHEPRELWLIYLNPEAEGVLRRFPRLREHARATLRLSPEDALPDRFGSDLEEVAVFHAAGTNPEVP